MPVWLIDVQEACLVEAKYGDRYVCLSYVWGQSHSANFSMTIANLDTLRKPRSLTEDSTLLPQTISHAMSLTRLLGEAYLWVDRLCIPQRGDGKTKSNQLSSMADIYGNAYFTIVAAQGDAEAGLRGISGVTPPRVLVEPLKYHDHYEAFTRQASKLMRSEWYTRGWTFQEHLCSRRKIIFHNDTMNWECHCSAWYENQELSGLDAQEASFPCEKIPPRNHTGFETTSWPNFYRYARLVALYNERSLTYPQDILDAFAGLLSVLTPTFDGGFICGLPQMFFDSALLWQPYRALQRREVKVDENALPTWPWIPSWSWIGWKGNLHSESWRSGYDYMKENPDEVLKIDHDGQTHWEQATWHTTHTVDWCYSEEIDSQQFPITVSSQKYRADAVTGQLNLPRGWTRTKSINHTGYEYRHDSIAEQEFWYPIPLQESPSPPQNLEHAQFRPFLLHARTRHCDLILGETYVNAGTSQCLSCDLLDADENWAGALRLNLPDHSKFGERTECRLIELSSGSVCNQETEAVSFDEWYRPDCPRHSGRYEFYNVLWVEDRGKISYRKALGRVKKSIWEKFSVEVDAILG